MFEEYLEDSNYFLAQAERAADEIIAKRYYRASTFCAANAMEAFVNYVADTLSKGAPLQPHEIAFISDKKYTFELNKPQLLVQKNEYHSLEDKLGMLIKKFIPNFDFKLDIDWKNIVSFKDLRDGLVHPRQAEDLQDTAYYSQTIRKTLKSIIVIMNKLYQAMFRSPLRRKLLDLIPD